MCRRSLVPPMHLLVYYCKLHTHDLEVKFTIKFGKYMKIEVIGFNLCNIDTGQLLAQSVRDFDFGIDEHRQKLHRMLDVFIDQCISHNTNPEHDTFCLEYKSYREHTDLLLPF